METLLSWLNEQLIIAENNIVKSEIIGDSSSLEFVRGQWNVLNHLKNKIESGHFI